MPKWILPVVAGLFFCTSLAPGASETLCFHVALPTSSSNAYQGLATTATFQFVAEQTANNP